jgi:membrane associated rhomboid family serine protease
MSKSGSFGIRSFYNSPSEGARLQQCKTLIWSVVGVNAAVFATWQFANNSREPYALQARRILNQNFLISLQHIRSNRYWTMITSEFSHVSLAHFGFNMVALYQLSQVLVYTPGVTAVSIAGLMVGSAVAASAGFLVDAAVARQANAHVQKVGLGASGIVSGITAAVAFMAPKMQILLFGIVPMPMWAFGVGTVLYDTYFLGGNTGIGHSAHLGGAAFGVAYYFLRLRKFSRFSRLF